MGMLFTKKAMRISLSSLVFLQLLIILFFVDGFTWQYAYSLFVSVCGLFLVFHRVNYPILKVIENPIAHIRFEGDMMLVGDLTFKAHSIHKVAIDVLDGVGYFSLPYNQISAGNILQFNFPVQKMSTLKEHLRQGLSDVQFIN
jgi:hypothetical protein